MPREKIARTHFKKRDSSRENRIQFSRAGFRLREKNSPSKFRAEKFSNCQIVGREFGRDSIGEG
jgi:hypothetical protein